MPTAVKVPAGFDAPRSTNLNVGNSAKDRSLERVICSANGFESEDKDLDYILYRKGAATRLIPWSRVCPNVALRPEWAATRDGDGSSPGQGVVIYPPMPLA